jgi:very-short-patch-repair endonuclease
MPTNAEAILWRELRNRRLEGYKFRRQWAVGAYVADFVCLEGRLIVELDGEPHANDQQRAHDLTRDAWLRGQGFEVLRFSNDLLLGGAGELVLTAIRGKLTSAKSPSSARADAPGTFSRQGRRKPPRGETRDHKRKKN